MPYYKISIFIQKNCKKIVWTKNNWPLSIIFLIIKHKSFPIDRLFWNSCSLLTLSLRITNAYLQSRILSISSNYIIPFLNKNVIWTYEFIKIYSYSMRGEGSVRAIYFTWTFFSENLIKILCLYTNKKKEYKQEHINFFVTIHPWIFRLPAIWIVYFWYVNT